MRRSLFLLLLLPAGFSPPAVPQALKAQSANEWFRHADELTNIRVPGSAPFHRKVTFHALPGLDFAKKGKSTIITGDGSCEETWVSPDQW